MQSLKLCCLMLAYHDRLTDVHIDMAQKRTRDCKVDGFVVRETDCLGVSLMDHCNNLQWSNLVIYQHLSTVLGISEVRGKAVVRRQSTDLVWRRSKAQSTASSAPASQVESDGKDCSLIRLLRVTTSQRWHHWPRWTDGLIWSVSFQCD